MKVILSSFPRVNDWKTEMQSRNKYILFKEFLIFHSCCSSLFFVQLSVRKDRRRGLLSKSGQAWPRGARGLKTGKNVRTSFMDGP